MEWHIPAKTFLIGEYAAVIGASAIVLTTSPCFTMSLTDETGLIGVHRDSPAGLWWTMHTIPHHGLKWSDPYNGQGGLGASSAQFLGAYLASCYLLQLDTQRKTLLEGYLECAWKGEGLRPSAYDLLAQTQKACVYINRHNKVIEHFRWGFKEIAFLLLHSGEKLATHYHLKTMSLPDGIHLLSPIVELAKEALQQTNSQLLIDAVNKYHSQLTTMQLVARHSTEYISLLKSDKDVLAAKGCGAMGADVILIIVPAEKLALQRSKLQAEGWTILATSENLYRGKPLIPNNLKKTLEILS